MRGRPQAALQRADLTAGRIGIENEDDFRGPAGGSRDPLRVSAQHGVDGAAAVQKNAGQPIEEGRVGAGVEEGFRRAHAGGGAGGEDNGGEFRSRESHGSGAFDSSCRKNDMESACQLDLGWRCTATISAPTLTAISSGVSAPMARPMGP
jgi:hypothetical protein